MTRPPLPPFTQETATQKARAAEDGWNSRDPVKVALAYTPDSQWRNRAEFLRGRTEIEAFLTRKWQRENTYRLIKELWAFNDNRIAVQNGRAKRSHLIGGTKSRPEGLSCSWNFR